MKKIAIVLLIWFCAIEVARSQTSPNIQARKFETLLSIIDRMYVDSVKQEKLVEDAIVGMLQELDPHSVYISKDELAEMNEPLVGNFEGIGIQFNIITDTIMVVSPISGGPSEKLGIRSGDRIVTVDGVNVAGIGIKNEDVTKKLRGDKGSHVIVGIFRKGEKEILEFDIERDKIPIFSVDATYMAAPQVGYIKINRFAATTMQEFNEGVKKLQKEGMKDLILDLRGNGGGYLNTAKELADEFLEDKKLIVYTEGRSSPKEELRATSSGKLEKGRLVVLVDEGSASASEIVSGAIQDWDRGLLIGRRSFGKGLVQKPYNLPDGSQVRLTVSRYYTPTGRSIQKPYEDGVDAYRKDLNNRFKKGEAFHVDSIKLPDSLKFYTPNKRVVYGGGGIMPDIFIPIDTTQNSDYFGKLLRKGLFNRFTLEYVDKNRKTLSKTYPDIKKFKQEFSVTPEFLNEFTAFAEKEGVAKDEADLLKSKKVIETQLKALIARSMWQTNGFYEIYNESDNGYLKAVEMIQSDEYKKMNFTN